MRSLILLLFLAISPARAQNHSYIKFNPPFGKDTLNIKDTDILKYDINIYYADSSFIFSSITGKLKIYSLFDISYDRSGFSVYVGAKMLTLSDPGKGINEQWDIKAQSNPNFPNILNFEYRDSHPDRYKAELTLANLKGFIESMKFTKKYFPVNNKYFVLRKRGSDIYKQYIDYSLSKKYIDVFFNKDDIHEVNVYNNEELILKVSYKALTNIK